MLWWSFCSSFVSLNTQDAFKMCNISWRLYTTVVLTPYLIYLVGRSVFAILEEIWRVWGLRGERVGSLKCRVLSMVEKFYIARQHLIICIKEWWWVYLAWRVPGLLYSPQSVTRNRTYVLRAGKLWKSPKF